MSALTEARSHLNKALEFLSAADVSFDLELYNAATSSAVTCGINCKDAICLKLTGQTQKTESHQDATRELRSAGASAARLAPPLGRLLRLKAKAQYQAGSISSSDAKKAVEWARRLYEGAQVIVTS